MANRTEIDDVLSTRGQHGNDQKKNAVTVRSGTKCVNQNNLQQNIDIEGNNHCDEVTPYLKRKLSDTVDEEGFGAKKQKMDNGDDIAKVADREIVSKWQIASLDIVCQEQSKEDHFDCEESNIIISKEDDSPSTENRQTCPVRDKPKRKEAFGKLYRLLRDDERIENGLSAKNPDAQQGVAYHVAKGSQRDHRSQYISTCSSLTAAENFRRLKIKSSHKYGNKNIAEIDVGSLPDEIQLIDLTSQVLRQKFTVKDDDVNDKFNKFANSHSEVLLTGKVPRECLRLIEFTGTIAISDDDSDDDSHYGDYIDSDNDLDDDYY